MIVAEWKAEPSRMGTPVIHTHLMLLQIAIRIIANLAFDPSLPAMVYIEKRTVRTTLKVGGTFFQVHIAIHHKSAIKKFCGLSWFPRRSRQKAAGQRNPQFQ